MITHCKVCEKEIKDVQFSTSYRYRGSENYNCDCMQYSFIAQHSSILKEDIDNKVPRFLTVESETIMSKNYFLIFFPTYQEASVVEKGEGYNNKRIVKTFALKELTHELAVQWVNKLKTYTIFQ